jgi:hypothetical protein
MWSRRCSARQLRCLRVSGLPGLRRGRGERRGTAGQVHRWHRRAPGTRASDGRQHGGHPVRTRVERRRRRLSDHAVDPDGRVLGGGRRRGRAYQHLRPAADLRRARGRARRRGGDRRPVDDRPALANFSSGQGIAYMHESLYAAVGKRLTYVLNVGARAMTKSTLNVHAGHDDYHCVDDAGFFQLFAKNVQSAADLNIISHRIAELALNPGHHRPGRLPDHPPDRVVQGARARADRRVPGSSRGHHRDADAGAAHSYGETPAAHPAALGRRQSVMAGLVQNQDAYMQSVAAQRPYFFDHVQGLTDRAFEEFRALTGRAYARVMGYRTEDAEYLILGQGSVVPSRRGGRRLPARDARHQGRRGRPADVPAVPVRPARRILKGRKGVAVLERLDQPLAADLPLMREIRASSPAASRTAATRSARRTPTSRPTASSPRPRRSTRARSEWAAATCSPRG